MISKITGEGGRCKRNELDGHTQIASQPVGIGDVEANQLSLCIPVAERNDMRIEAYAQHAPLADIGDRRNSGAGILRETGCCPVRAHSAALDAAGKLWIEPQRSIRAGCFREELRTQGHAAESKAGEQDSGAADSSDQTNR